MNRYVYPATAQQRRVRGIDNRVHIKAGNVAFDDFDQRRMPQACPGFRSSTCRGSMPRAGGRVKPRTVRHSGLFSGQREVP